METRPVILAAVAAAAEALAGVAEAEPLYVGTGEKATVLRELAGLLGRVEELRLRVIAVADDVAEASGARDVAGWVAHEARLDRGACARDQRLAAALEHRHHRLRAALREGAVNPAQARVIATALDELPEDLYGDPSGGVLDDLPRGLTAAELDARTRAEAEEYLIAQAAHHSPRELRRLGRKLLEVVAPAVAEEHERRLVEREHDLARRRTTLTSCRTGDGTTLLRARVPDAVADRLLTYLHAFTSPRRRTRPHARQQTATGPVSAPGSGAERLPYPMRLGRAFCSLLETLDPDHLPVHGGRATTVVVTLDLETLLSELGTATTDTGQVLTAGEARRLACTADLVPAVLGGPSEVLDLGRSSRLFSRVQRRALQLRDQTCRAEGCDIPAAWCEAHHLVPWSRGGRTDLDDGILLCSHHHHRIHDHRYHHQRLPDGNLSFHRRT